MPNLKSQIPNLKSQILLLAGALLLLGAVAWGIGWAAHSLFDRWAAPPPTATVEPTAPLPTAVHSPTASPASQLIATPTQPATSTSAPGPATSTAAPTVEEKKVETFVVVESDRGLNDVVRRACELPRDYLLDPDDAIMQETRELNGFILKDPIIFEGQEVLVPVYLCPN